MPPGVQAPPTSTIRRQPVNPNTLLLPTVWPRAAPTTVQRCVLLALLLHVWLVLTLGSAPGGTAQPGQGVWGAINITLRGPERPGPAVSQPLPEPAVPSGPAGAAETARWGGAVRSAPPVEADQSGAAQLGTWMPAPERVLLPDLPSPTAPAAALPLAEAAPTMMPPSRLP